ncbi:phage tail protein, partial [Baaleninema sp.]|uniref:phage tail protein n=1 Tax=Baaleninema sp. TaxID=3101197 RepID=UPI003D035810
QCIFPLSPSPHHPIIPSSHHPIIPSSHHPPKTMTNNQSIPPPANFVERLTSSRFYVELKLDGGDDNVDAIFSDCQGGAATQEVTEICEVTPERWGSESARYGRVRRTKIPGNVKIDNLVLKRGMTQSSTLWQWFAAVRDGNWNKQRRDGSISVYDLAGKEQARFEFFRAWPTRYKIADFNANSSEIEIEELELAVEDLIRVPPADSPGM